MSTAPEAAGPGWAATAVGAGVVIGVFWLTHAVLGLPDGVAALVAALLAVLVSVVAFGPRESVGIGIGVGLAVVAPFVLGPYDSALVLSLAIIAIGQNVVTGTAGQLAIGNGPLAAIGAYTTAILVATLGWPWPAAVVPAVLIAAISAYLLSIPAFRLRGPFLAMATISLALVFPLIAKSTRLEWLTGGALGTHLDHPAAPAWLGMSDELFTYFVFLPVGLVAAYFARELLGSRHGRAMRAVRDVELAADVAGVPTRRYKRLAFTISGAFAGLGGAFFALVVGLVTPDQFGIFFSVQFLVMIVLGGLDRVSGAVVGALVVFLLQISLPLVPIEVGPVNVTFSPAIVYGAILIFAIVLMPQGVVGTSARFLSSGRAAGLWAAAATIRHRLWGAWPRQGAGPDSSQ